MNASHTEAVRIKKILERTRSELVLASRKRDGIAIEKSADPMDEIQYASERDLAIRNVDRESRMLRQVIAALQRLDDGSFGNCVDCECAVSQKRLAAVPWALRCIRCQDAFDRQQQEPAESAGEDFVNAA